jgi:hypothetical protein
MQGDRAVERQAGLGHRVRDRGYAPLRAVVDATPAIR